MAKLKKDTKEAIEYSGSERMNPDLERKLKLQQTTLSKNPAFPDVDKDGTPDNFEELVASKRFKDVVEKVKRYTGMQEITGQNAFMQAKEFTKATEGSSLAITKLDGTAKGGVVIGISDQFKIPVKFIGVGEKMTDLQLFNRTEFVDSLFKKN